MKLSAGMKLGPYRIVAPLGHGGMGEVYHAEDERLGRGVAIKILPEHLSKNPDMIRRFEREARALAALSHKNVLTIFDVGSDQDISYVVMELLSGTTLRNYLKEQGTGDKKYLLTIARAIAEGLAAAHSNNIIHRDLKPENIFITSDGTVKILDFGLARQIRTDPLSEAETHSAIIAGTVPYMAPEQLRGQYGDTRTDVFAFGCILQEMLTGKSPFDQSTTADAIASILHHPPQPLPREIPSYVAKLIGSCLQKDPAKRIPSAGEIVSMLQTLNEKTITTSKTIRTARPQPVRSKKAINSLAILPFENASQDSEMEYFSDGITEELISSLSHLPKLKVMARGTVFHYRNKGVTPIEAGRQLNVGAVLTGRVFQRGNRILIGTELLDVENGWHLWGEQYNRNMADLFALQSEIVREISGKLRLKLTGKEKKILAKHYTDNTTAYQTYLKGRYFWNRRTEEGLKKALDYFGQAIAIDPLYALAYTGLADTYALMADFGVAFTPREAFSCSKAAVMRALEIDPELAETHTSLAHLKMHEFQWNDAMREFARAHELNPGYATAHHWHFMSLTMLGKHEEATHVMKKAEDIDPLSLIIQTDIAACHYFRGNYDTAIRILRKTLEMDRNFASAHRYLAAVYEQKEMFGEAIHEYEKARIAAGKDPEKVASQVLELRDALKYGANGYWRQRMEQTEKQAQQTYVPGYVRAQLWASLGERDRAFELLDQALDEPSASLIYLKIDPRFASLRDDPRFVALLQKLNLFA